MSDCIPRPEQRQVSQSKQTPQGTQVSNDSSAADAGPRTTTHSSRGIKLDSDVHVHRHRVFGVVPKHSFPHSIMSVYCESVSGAYTKLQTTADPEDLSAVERYEALGVVGELKMRRTWPTSCPEEVQRELERVLEFFESGHAHVQDEASLYSFPVYAKDEADFAVDGTLLWKWHKPINPYRVEGAWEKTLQAAVYSGTWNGGKGLKILLKNGSREL